MNLWRGLGMLGVLLLVVPGATTVAGSDDSIVLVVGKSAPALEQHAAREMAAQFKRLFAAPVTIANQIPKATARIIFVGRPQTNSALRSVIGNAWPEKLSDQGVVIRRFPYGEHSATVVGGGSPVATLWAVYELGHQLGIRYTLKNDIDPDAPVEFKLPENLVQEPKLRVRTWRAVNDFAMGQESWSLAEHRQMLQQLAKLKFNRVMISVYPWQPFVDYELDGVRKQTATLWYGEKLTIPRDAPGRTALGVARVFENPHFSGKHSYAEMIEAGNRYLNGIIDEAKNLGMSVGISISPLEFPKEFAAVLPGAQPTRGLNRLLVAPGPEQGPHDELLRRLVATKLRAYLKSYPRLDALYLTLPEFPQWQAHVGQAWRETAQLLGADAPKLDDLLEGATKRELVAGGERGRTALKSNLVALSFLRRLFQDKSLLQRGDGRSVSLIVTSVDPALFPYLDRLLPRGSETQAFVDYTARRVALHRRLLTSVPAKKVPSHLIMTLADDNVGVLSQSSLGRLEPLVKTLAESGWSGFSTRHWMLAELDPSFHYLSRASWNPSLSARAAHDDLFVQLTGKQAVADRLWLAFGHMEKATELIDEKELGFAFPVQGMFLKHYKPKPIPPWWDTLNEHYTQAMVELYRSHDAAHPRCRRLLFYWAKRSEYVLEYLAAVKALRQAALAEKDGDQDQALEYIETAMEQLYNAIDTLSDVARDQSDRGLIAMLIAYAYQPLVAKYEQLMVQ